jgi:hypothetical protein
MNKREFLETGDYLAGSALERAAAAPKAALRTGRAGNLTPSTNNLQTPATVDEVRAAVGHFPALFSISRHEQPDPR